MTPAHQHLLEGFFAKHLGANWKRRDVVFLDGMATVAAMWPMNSVFREHHALIGSIAYSPAHEIAADQAIEAFVNGERWTPNDPAPETWRVLMERHLQAVQVALANHLSGNARVVPLPKGLPPALHMPAAMLYLQWAMALPFPVVDRAGHQWSATSPVGNLRRH